MADNVSIAGAGVIAGGKYQKISVSGSCKFKDDIECETLGVSGSTKAMGSLTANEVKISGSFKGDRDISCKSARISGGFKIDGNFKCNTVTTSGSIDVGGDIEAQEFKSSGSVKARGSVNAEIFDCKLASCDINELYGETVILEKHNYGVKNFDISINLGFFKFNADKDLSLRVNEIEATNITLKGVKALRVSGENVDVDSSCEIDTIEYMKELKIAQGAKVKRIIKI